MRHAPAVAEARVLDPEVTDVPGSTYRPFPPAPPPSRPTADGPPPPPASSGSDAESRTTAAAWVAAVGAALLLAAAGTFLAVSWDALGLTARVAVVASVTGAAILGGRRLRRVLPAVGAVVFHLGALLVPVDALGLAYQLDASVAVRWAAVGLTASLALPVLAVVGRSRLLGSVGLIGLPVAATGAGIAGYAHPAIVLVGLAMAATIVEVIGAEPRTGLRSERRPGHRSRRRSDPFGAAGGALAIEGPLGPARRLAAPGLASLAVMVPLALTTVARAVGSGTVLGSAAGGWVASSWVVPASVGVVAAGALAVTATHRRHTGIAGLALASAVVSGGLTVLPPATPRAVLLLVPAVIWLLTEVAALAGRGAPLWATPTRVVATVLEVLAVAGVIGSLVVLLVLAGWYGVATDPSTAMRSLILAVAWMVAGLRRGLPGPRARRGGMVVVFGAVAMIQGAAAVLQFGGTVELSGLVLLVGAVGSLGVLGGDDLRRTPVAGPTARGVPPFDPAARGVAPFEPAARGIAPFAALALIGVAAIVLLDTLAVGLVLVVLPLLLGAHLAVALRSPAQTLDRNRADRAVVAGALVVGVAMLAWIALAVDGAGRWPSGAAILLAVLGLLWLAGRVDRLEPAAETLYALAMLAGLVVLVPLWQLGGPASGADRSGLFWAYGLRVVPAAFVPAALVGGWMTVEAIRRRRRTIAALAAPVVLRAVAAGLLGAGASIRVTGALLLVVAVAAGCVAAVGPRRLVVPMVTSSAFASVVGWLLIGDAPTLRAGLLVAAGLGIAAMGASRGRPLVAHLGGVVATIGVWQLLGIHRIDALDVWLLPVAAQLTLAGEVARRRGSSSWVAFVPPLLLVAIPALGERIAGGGGWHAVLAAAVGIVAIVSGGVRRLGGPLVVGTVVTVTVVLVETFAVVAAVPTWVWLAVGGVLLLGVAALIERLGGSPVRVVRRAVDVVGERFA